VESSHNYGLLLQLKKLSKINKHSVGAIWSPCVNCGNNGQGNPVDNLYSKRVKSTLTSHKQKHLHLYQINGRSEPLGVKWSQSDPSWNKNIKQFYVKQKIGGKKMEYKNRRENGQNNEHDKIIQYFPQNVL
jgi:hypothetical protein